MEGPSIEFKKLSVPSGMFVSMFKNLFKKFDVVLSRGEKNTHEEKFFSNVVGYADIKKLLLKTIVSKEPGIKSTFLL